VGFIGGIAGARLIDLKSRTGERPSRIEKLEYFTYLASNIGVLAVMGLGVCLSRPLRERIWDSQNVCVAAIILALPTAARMIANRWHRTS
jgi:hypothetical protein